MRPTAGILMLCFVLSVSPHVLRAAPSCKIKEQLKHLEHELKDLISSLNLSHIRHTGEGIRNPVINKSLPISESAVCGLKYVEKALEKIRAHWPHTEKELNHVIRQLKHSIIHCAQHVLGNVACNHEDFNLDPSDYNTKQWIKNFLESSEKFLHQLINEHL